MFQEAKPLPHLVLVSPVLNFPAHFKELASRNSEGKCSHLKHTSAYHNYIVLVGTLPSKLVKACSFSYDLNFQQKKAKLIVWKQ